MENNFPEKLMVTLKGTFYKKGKQTYHTFISFDGGRNLKIIGSNIQNVTIINRGGILLGTENKVGRVWYSYDDRWKWSSTNIVFDNSIRLIPIESGNNPVIVATYYDNIKKLYTLYVFNFSNIISRSSLMADRTCEMDDFEPWYMPRYSGTCYQGQEVSYMKKKRFSMCVDDRSLVPQSIKSCPCSIEDFEWYNQIKHSKPNYYYNDNFCVSKPSTNIKKSVKSCRDGGTPLMVYEG
ncbi:Vacuolar protein sorting/targeting protein 10 [Thelohanellus kitauei]|uniref:Vacuolar protein sorting/targeting protein 10 n=1 Tax=Thelohanellus kitauei TaxID=669202 RepID=A0A0C2J3P5_THEKT|nr:Vacuolar protein sorting/targeting protein 10 [Thelohanellus kitauei]KII63692.1 Vacuolar protein sorting/targeting protein 10 [Thelohanellus kitauei]